MPYIKKQQRPYILETPITKLILADPGQLNYAVCELFMRFCDSQEGKLSYATIEAGIGAIRGAADELVERIKKPYERGKRLENGDLFLDFIRKHNLKEISG